MCYGADHYANGRIASNASNASKPANPSASWTILPTGRSTRLIRRDAEPELSEDRPSAMRVIAVVNQKGGSGKTTTAVNLAAALGERGRRVLVLDLDPQANASAWLGVRDGGSDLLDVLSAEDGDLAQLVRPSSAQGVDLIPASNQLALADRYLAEALGGERILLGLIEGLPHDRWDYVFIDCPPSLGHLTINALGAARELLVPVEASPMAVAGLAGLLRTVTQANKRLNPNLVICGIFACRVDTRTVLARDVVAALRERFPGVALATAVHETVRLREASGQAEPINVYAPASTAAADYRALADEIAGQEQEQANALRTA
jgi:chromosome partitioning protein